MSAAMDLDGLDRLIALEQRTALPRRHFYRCPDCLTVAAHDHPGKHPIAIACDGCRDGATVATLEHMGYVTGPRFGKETLRCPCDERCTSARGPNCECSCGGENHGHGLLCVTDDAGPIPVARPAHPDKALATARAWRTACAETRAAIQAAYPEIAQKARGQYLSAPAFARYCDGTRLMRAYLATRALRGPQRLTALRKLTPTQEG